MLNQTLEQIILQINIQRVKSKDSSKTSSSQNNSDDFPYDTKNHHLYQRSSQDSTKSISPDQRSCSRSWTVRPHQLSQDSGKIYRKKWTRNEEQLLCNLIGHYGSDFTFLQTQFPNKTRKQLKKKYQEIHKNKRYVQKIQRIEESIIRQRRKSLFDDEIMEIANNQLEGKSNCIKGDKVDNVYHDIQEQSQGI